MVVSTPIEEIETRVQLVREGFNSGALRTVEARRAQLERLKAMIVDHEHDIAQALHTDLGKSPHEVYVTETGFTINEIDHALDHLDKWTAERKVKLPLVQRPGSGRVIPKPRGTVLIIAPWNYPFQLTIAPLIPAIAAGNTAVLKPSEVAGATATLLARLVPEYLDERIVQVVNGGIPETTDLLARPWDHIFYTGNGTVGRIVMRAAADHLTPVTLELGGKSPTIVTGAANVDVAARRIAWGKFLNAGQTCVAPDYVLVESAIAGELEAAIAASIETFYGGDPFGSADYSRIINTRHHDRLGELLDAGGYERVVTGGDRNRDQRYLAPTVLGGVSPDAAVMQEEIFGPILPIIPVTGTSAAIEFVNARPHPLALYVFTEDDDEADWVLESTLAGGSVVNHTLFHLTVPNMPFGGVGASGMGSYHGETGFDTFSHLQPVLRRPTRPDLSIAYPPYGKMAQKAFRKVL